MASVGAGFVFIHGCLGVVRGACCESDLSTDGRTSRHAHFDCALQRDTCAICHADEQTDLDADADARWDVDSNPDSEPDADCYGYRAPNLDSLQNAHTHVHTHCDSHQIALANGRLKRARHTRGKDFGSPTGDQSVVPYPNTDEDGYTGPASYINDHTYGHSFPYLDIKSEIGRDPQRDSHRASNRDSLADWHPASNSCLYSHSNKYGHAGPESDTYIYTYSSSNFNVVANSYPTPNHHLVTYFNAYIYANCYLDAYSHPHPDSDSNSDAASNSHFYIHLDKHIHSHSEFHTYVDIHTLFHGDGYANSHSHPHLDAISNSDAASNLDSDAHAHTAPNRDVYTYAKSYACAHAHTAVPAHSSIFHR